MKINYYLLSDFSLEFNLEKVYRWSGSEDLVVNNYLGKVTEDNIEQIIEGAIRKRAILFYAFSQTLLKEKVENILNDTDLASFNFLEFGLCTLFQSFRVHKREQIKTELDYFKKIKAMEFSLQADERVSWDKLDEADIILLGVSCTAKTPLALYLGYLGYKVSNLPLVPEISLDIDKLLLYQNKIVGLTIKKDYLKELRKRKISELGLPINSKYSQESRILEEIDYAEEILSDLEAPVIDVTDKSIEKLAIEVLEAIRL
ncbi:kinase/pyrophosphorylase [Natroniella sulfidigena]|uniref:kinase/pyrophosphorylase n=1 Tax=Natroniella sulfidigena TaxID=723921 RepID=UPI00200A9A00|nr:kinase/pyrophosphorylase [Natroniella sulfidigena]MCK8815941.1 kinase/pyrophosphorylase [Natroniella sulfidigena]